MTRFALRYPYFIIVSCLATLVVGITSLVRLPVDLFPEIKMPVVIVATFYPGMPPEQIEQDLTSRLERFLTLAGGIDHMESRSLPGASLIKIYFQPGTSSDSAVSSIGNLAMAELRRLPPGTLPRTGIEVQVLDLGYETNWLREKGKHSDWFTSHGDVFPVGQASMTAFTPEITYTAEDGTRFTCGNQKSSRCFPTKRLTKPAGEWNHYYVRAIQGEVRLWVNGEEVSGGTKCTPSQGYLALEAEGARIEYRNLRLRELP